MNEEEYSAALNCPIFGGMARDAAAALLADGRVAAYAAGQALIAQGEPVRRVGVLLRGEAEASALDAEGRRVVLARVPRGGVFGDVLAASRGRVSPVSVAAAADCRALWLPFERLAGNGAAARNLLGIFSDKYFELHDRVNCLTQPTLRGKILYYLSRAGGGGAFNIPFDRARLADYLNADRSALSRELSAMKRGGLIDYYKNTFRVL